jgi:hypothetical protein
MSLKGFLVKIGDKLFPATEDDKNMILSLQDGEIIPFSMKDSRKLWRQKKYWLMLKKVCEHMPEHMSEKYPTPEKVHIEIKLQNGLFDVHITLQGKETYVVSSKVGSTSFDNMGEAEFMNFINTMAKPTILKYFLFGVTPEDFDKEFLSIMFD